MALLPTLRALALATAAVAAALALTPPARAADAPPTDAEVLESMRKGAHYLLDELAKKDPANNWESKFGPDQKPLHGDETWNTWNCGGETGVALYALLHVGESVTDDEELGPRLKFNSKELAPVVKWLSTVRPDTTYSAGLQSSALALVPKDTEPYKAAQVALKANSYYFSTAMSLKGGFGYSGPIAGTPAHNKARGIIEVWRWYWEARQAGAVPTNLQAALEAMGKQASARFGGFQGQVQYVVADLKQREADAKLAKNAALVVKIQAEQKEFQGWVNQFLARKLEGDKNTPQTDLSNSQYGILGAWALSDADVEMPMAYWQIADKFWRQTQKADGQWPYDPNAPEVRPSMTVAGIASLYITSSMIDMQIRLEPKPDPEIDRGIAWLNQNFKPLDHWYYMYGVERVGLASGLKNFGTTNWYTDGAKLILQRQRPEGNWEGGEGGNTVATAYALLFLARGRNPVMFNKLQYDNGPWNARPRDNANITNWISKKMERPINWQVVNLKVDPQEWLDAPVLLITGSKALDFTPDEVAKLRTYINSGGMIFSTADGGAPEFTESIQKLASAVVEENGQPKYEMRELPKDNVLFSLKNELWTPIANPPRILAMSNGVREIWVHSTVDMGASWQGRKVANTDHFVFPTNLYRYASGKASLRTKLQPLTVTPPAGDASRIVKLARIDYPGNWDPEPGAWPRFAKLLRRDVATDVQIKTSKIADLNATTTPIAHITGTTGFPINGADVAALKKYLASGGTLVADAAGASPAFKTSVEKLIEQATGKTLAAIPPDNRLYNGSITGSVNVTKTEYRMFYRLTVPGARTAPQLKGIDLAGRWAVIYSAEDITSGFLGTNTWGILGYSSDSAVNLGRNILLYSLNPKAGKDGP